jgi:carbon-monoxide dehydrogenase large subunit
LGAFAAPDLAGLGPIPCQMAVPTRDPMRVPARYALASDRVRYVGEPVALVVARTRQAARDAAELVEIDYETLPAVVDARQALAPDAPPLWPDVPGNLAYIFEKGDRAAVEAVFAAAAHVTSLDLVNNRVIIAALEPRAALGRFDPADDTFHLLYSGAQVHGVRDALADTVFRLPRERIHVVCPDVGGGFGVKNALYPEYILVLWAARTLGCPVRWTADRSEDMVSTAHGRDNLTRARLALDADGRFLALAVDTIANLGAAMSSGGPGPSTTAPGNAMGSGYAFAAVHMQTSGVYTNTVPTDAYRGAGKPEANYLLERLIDLAALQLGHDAIELRRRNLVHSFPHRTPMATSIDGGRFADNIDPALAASDHAGFPARRAQSEQRGRLRGIGVTCFLETARGAPDEGAEIRFQADGQVALLLGSQSNGQGHETVFPQLAATLLGLPIERFRYIQADTALIPRGHGHGGARSLHQGGTALVRAAEQVIAKGRATAARLLQAHVEAVEFADGVFTVAGRQVGLLEVAEAADEPLDSYVWNKLDLITFPNGVHVAEVEIDPETGATVLQRYTAVDDFGTVLNPLLTIGQIQGGLAQGIGQALLERTAYEAESGQLLSGSLMDYCLPRAADLPDLDIRLDGVPTSANPLGTKGAGQAGAIAAPPAVIAAVLDALGPLGVKHIDMPATPEAVWRAINVMRR